MNNKPKAYQPGTPAELSEAILMDRVRESARKFRGQGYLRSNRRVRG